VSSPHRELRGKRVVVLGLGKSGVAAARLCAREGALVTASEARPESALGPVAEELRAAGVWLETGGHLLETFTGADLIVKSPGVLPTQAELSAAREAGVPVIGEVELCAPWLDGPIVGITGTNGKSTTTALLGHLLTTGGRKPFVGGNLGTPVAQHVLAGHKADATVLELSSYQIDDLETFRCQIAVILNLTPDHLERYGTMERYGAAKERLLSLRADSGLAIVNGEDEATSGMGERAASPVVRFGHGNPAAGDIREKHGTIVRFSPEGSEERYTVGASALRGSHNLENAMAAIEAARTLGVPVADVQRGLDTYPGLPHRIEHVRTLNKVDWVNDSKATNVDSVEKSLGAFTGMVHLIMGGRGKGASYEPLRSLVREKVIRLYLIGEEAEAIEEEFRDETEIERCSDLATAVDRASVYVAPGDTVLLSPACASFDQFRSFEHRGDTFRALVQALPEEL
jgi:UDP-N-acetylmuramoylalanine--D-glutamate ligase